MSKVKINSAQYDELKNHTKSAYTAFEEAEKLWGDTFEDLYYAFITSGYLNDLYEDAKSSYYTLKKSVSALSNVVSGAALGCAIGGWVGAIVGAVIGFFFGVYEFCTTDPTWITTSKEVFENLLTNCVNGNNDAYIGIINVGTKIYNMQVSLEEIRTKINEFNHKYADFSESMNELGLSGTMTDDGVLLSVDTEIVVNGQTVKTSVSEALNAFYTYQNTVMASRIEAQYLADNYGIEIDYDALVQNANGFIVNSLNSGLYSHEFIQGLLPEYNPNVSDATAAAAGSLGITTGEFQSVLSAAGIAGVGAGLLGAGFMGRVRAEEPEEPSRGTTPTTPSTPSGGGQPSGGGGGTTTPTQSTPVVVPSGGGGTTTTTPTESTPTTPSESTPTTETKPEETVTNDIEIEEISDEKIPETVEDKVTKDYDDLARREYESQGREEIEARREEIIDEVNDAFRSGDFSDIRDKLKDYGYTNREIEQLCQSRDKLTLALIEGEQRAVMAERAMELAEADGVEDYESSYSEADYSDLTNGNANALIANMSEDEEVSDAFEKMTETETDYSETIVEATVAVEAVALSKQALEGLQEKFTKEFGTSDTTKWSEEAAKEYNDAVKEHNEKVEDAKKKLDAKDKAKEEYEEAKEEYEDAKVDFEKRIKEGLEDSEDNSDGNRSDYGDDYNDGYEGDYGYENGGNDIYYPNGEPNYGGEISGYPSGGYNDGYGNGGYGNGTSGQYIPPGENFPDIGMDMRPADNANYASENLGYDVDSSVVNSSSMNGYATNNVSISDAELLAALNIADNEVKFKDSSDDAQ